MRGREHYNAEEKEENYGAEKEENNVNKCVNNVRRGRK